MKKRLLATLLALCMVLGMLPGTAGATSGNCGTSSDDVWWSLDIATGTLVISGTGDMENYHLYESSSGFSSSSPWNESQDVIAKVIIKNGVTSIGRGAFAGCKNLKKVSLPDSINQIETRAFAGCISLENIILPNSISSIKEGAFLNCTSLKTVSIPSSILFIMGTSFQQCSSLSSVTIPDTVKRINLAAFSGCDNLTEVYYLGTETQWRDIFIAAYNEALTSATIHYNSRPTPQPPQTYDLEYDLNGGTGDVPGGMCVDAGTKITVASTVPTRAGYTFKGWSDGTGIYQAGTEYTMPACDVVLRAQWEKAGETPKKYTVSYSINTVPIEAEIIGTIPEPMAYKAGDTVTIPNVNIVLEGHEFKGWVNGTNIYAPGSTFIMPEHDVGLTAVMEQAAAAIVDPLSYLGKVSNKTGLTGARIATINVDAENRAAFVNGILQGSSANIPSADYDAISSRINALLFSASYRPQVFGGSTATINGYPRQNNFGCAKYYNITDSDLGHTVGYNRIGDALGCLAYARASACYVYPNNPRQVKKWYQFTDGNDIRNTFHQIIDPGEALGYEFAYYSNGKWNETTHALLYLGDDISHNGFYFLSYGGGQTGSYNLNEIEMGYLTYDQFYNIIHAGPNGFSHWIYFNDMNQGSYALQTFQLVAQCPIEMIVTINGQVLDSRTMSGDPETIKNDYAVMTASGLGQHRNVQVEIVGEYIERGNARIEFLGTDSGTMTVSATQIYNTGESDTYVFQDVPVTSTMTADLLGVYPHSTLELVVSDTATPNTYGTWEVNPGETAKELTRIPVTSAGGMIENMPSFSGTALISLPVFSHGKVVSTSLYAAPNDWVTLYATPDEGYKLESITVTDARGWPVSLRDLGDGAYSFTMPSARVNVSAVFAESEAPSATNVPDVTNPAGIGAWTPTLVEKFPVVNTVPMAFADVGTGDWFYDSVLYTWQRSLMTGTSATAFAPNGTMTRAMVWTVLARLNGRETSGGSPWYQKALDYVVYNSISDGTEPNGDITRQQLVTMLWRNAGEPYASSANLTGFSDAGQVAEWADGAVRWAVSAGILQGNEAGRLNPAATATRAEVSAILMRYCGSAS